MPIYDEYRIVINEAQRKVIMRAPTNTMANDRQSTSKGGTLSRPTHDAYMQLFRLFSTITPSRRK
jgi:monoamine oxidase